ncbi:methyltransferase domain-containing protein [Mesorhizobium sp. WSM2239]|uniref:Methyltransferase domain-containing protein n=2 Tax=unclassified Mesorhizobium TaxID=325217 RepID=A0AAU8D2W9_9HYPH
MTDSFHAEVAARWNENANQWTRDVGDGYDVYRDRFTFPAFQDFLPPLGGLEIIDFGCGEGTNTRRLARMGARLTGVDISERLIDYARQARTLSR